MSDRTKTTTRPTASTAGVLRPDQLARHVTLEREPAGPGVERWVENHWSLRWDLPAGTSFASQVLPHPTCSLTVERGSHPRPGVPAGHTALITGVVTERFDVDVRGWGRVLGVRFRPGGLGALSGRPASAWTDRVLSASDVLPEDLCVALADPELTTSPAEWRAAAEDGLRDVSGDHDQRYDELLRIVTDMLTDRSLLTVAAVAGRHGVTVRTLQRLFTRYVGVGPKWVLARYRMHDVVTELDAGHVGSLSELAARYGWYDQAHFTRDFTASVGVTPGQYRSNT